MPLWKAIPKLVYPIYPDKRLYLGSNLQNLRRLLFKAQPHAPDYGEDDSEKTENVSAKERNSAWNDYNKNLQRRWSQ